MAVHQQMAVSSLDQTRDRRTSGPWAYNLYLLGTWLPGLRSATPYSSCACKLYLHLAMYPAGLNTHPDLLQSSCLGTKGLFLCWRGHCPCLHCCGSAPSLLSFQSNLPSLLSDKWPTEFISAVSRNCFTFASIVRTNLDKYLQGVKPLMSEMLTGRATKFSHLLVLTMFSSRISPSLLPFLHPSPSQDCFLRCFLTPTIWNSHGSLLRPSSRHLLGPDRD